MSSCRLDQYLVKNKMVKSRSQAQDLIINNKVLVNNEVVNKSNAIVNDSDKVKVNTDIYVSRGAYKLICAIDNFKLDLKNKVVLDIGSSTGGFSQVALLNDAKRIYAIDVGTNQMDESISSDKRIKLSENTDFRNISANLFDQKIDFVCCDVSFISLKKIIDKLVELFDYSYCGIFLIKPQFEAIDFKIKNFKGVIKDEKIRNKIVEDMKQYFKDKRFRILNLIKSPITGKEGNIEYLIYVSK